MPLLSIISINLNNKQGLEQTILSVLSQSFSNYEYLIIDGASNDGSQEVIEKYRDKLFFSCSEPDSGIYDAMNKGIRHASGDYLLFLNSGDYLISPDVLEKLFQNKLTADIVSADVLLKNSKGQTLPKSSVSTDQLSILTFLKSSLWHQSTLIKRDLFEKLGLYRTDLRFVSDWAFFVDAIFRHNASYDHVPFALSVYLMEGATCDPKNLTRLRTERERVLTEYFPALYKDLKNYLRLEVLDHIPGIQFLLKLYPLYQVFKRKMERRKYC